MYVGHEGTPREETLIGISLEELLLKSNEGISFLSVRWMNVDAKYPHERIGFILHTGRLPSRGPRHPSRNAHFLQGFDMREDITFDISGISDQLGKASLRAEDAPLSVQKYYCPGGEELLQRPSAPMPSALAELRNPLGRCNRARDVREEGIAHLGIIVPAVHGGDRLR